MSVSPRNIGSSSVLKRSSSHPNLGAQAPAPRPSATSEPFAAGQAQVSQNQGFEADMQNTFLQETFRWAFGEGQRPQLKRMEAILKNPYFQTPAGQKILIDAVNVLLESRFLEKLSPDVNSYHKNDLLPCMNMLLRAHKPENIEARVLFSFYDMCQKHRFEPSQKDLTFKIFDFVLNHDNSQQLKYEILTKVMLDYCTLPAINMVEKYDPYEFKKSFSVAYEFASFLLQKYQFNEQEYNSLLNKINEVVNPGRCQNARTLVRAALNSSGDSDASSDSGESEPPSDDDLSYLEPNPFEARYYLSDSGDSGESEPPSDNECDLPASTISEDGSEVSGGSDSEDVQVSKILFKMPLNLDEGYFGEQNTTK